MMSNLSFNNAFNKPILSFSDLIAGFHFILAPNYPHDWRSPQNDNLWQGVSGTNNPCPSGYRLPTEAEWVAEYATWSSTRAPGAFASVLKLPLAGIRSCCGGGLEIVGTGSIYWTSTVSGTQSRTFYFEQSLDAGISNSNRADGRAVRCIKN